MSKFTLTGTRIFSGGTDLTGVSNKVDLSTDREEKDVTTFASLGATEYVGGLAKSSFTASGFWEAGDTTLVDDSTWAALGGVAVVTVCPAAANLGDVAWLTKGLTGSYQVGASIGDVAPWSAKTAGAWPLARGVVLSPPGTARTVTGTGTPVLYQAATSAQYVYIALHVLSVSGTTPSLTVTVQSDSTVGFASPATVGTFTAATGRTGEILRFAGPLTDTYYRVSYTISGTTPSFLFVTSVGVA